MMSDSVHGRWHRARRIEGDMLVLGWTWPLSTTHRDPGCFIPDGIDLGRATIGRIRALRPA